MANEHREGNSLSHLVKNTGFLYILSLSSQVVNLALIPFETRVLGSEAYGVIALAVSMSAIVTLVLDFGFILSATERVVGLVGDKEGLAQILGDVALAKTWLSVLVGLIIGVLVVSVSPFTDNRLLFLLYYLAYSANAFLPDFFYRGHEDMRVITLRTVAIKVVSALPIFLLLKGPRDMCVVPMMLLVGNIGAVAFSYVDILRRYEVTVVPGNWRSAIELMKSSFGFFVSRFASVFYQSMNAVLLGLMFPGQAVVGHYGASEKFLSYTKTMSSPVADSLYPYMVRTKNYRLCKILLVVTAPLIAIAAFIAWTFAEPLCTLVFGEGYEGSAVLLKCLLPAIMVIFPTYILCFPMLVPMGLSDYANRSNVVGAVVQTALVGGLFLTDNLNAMSICLASSSSEVAVFLYRLWAVVAHRDRMHA